MPIADEQRPAREAASGNGQRRAHLWTSGPVQVVSKTLRAGGGWSCPVHLGAGHAQAVERSRSRKRRGPTAQGVGGGRGLVARRTLGRKTHAGADGVYF